MARRVSDFIPPASKADTEPTRPRRGGARPGAGAPKGNLNALKHGRRSRFKDAMPLAPPQPLAVARRLLAREQRDAERYAVTLMQIARAAQYHRERAAAVAEGRPLPPPPLRDTQSINIRGLNRFLRAILERKAFEEARTAGLLTPNSPLIQKDTETARNLELLVRHATHALDQTLAATPSPAALATALPTPNNQTNNQPEPPLLESIDTVTSALLESTPSDKTRNIQSFSPSPP
jgi:hypothetical protein